ncbi:zinc finger CCCH domain-containing protein 14 [Diorhabda sublineata]|uniref:zinc finger CCCH domain-containing protein 14 n=1 Tax=Diorhabda sublineata TaxID=1163346 RepID=UPI0024E0DCD2|nr:zinc finger CCCH domain-containing protein 14 [Diorhabda sublineata]
MDNVGAEVGQKMRSAIKAKLLELNCYVDDELPDYIMVMVANRRSKSQMNEDLNLFLNTKTSAFVEWLHIVLKKLKEVTVTNPEVYKKVAKRKSSEQIDVKVKKEKLKRIENVKKESQNDPLKNSTSIDKNNAGEFDIPLLTDINSSSENDLKEIEAKIRNVKSRLGIVVDGDVNEEILRIKIEEAKNNTIQQVERYSSPNEREVVLNEEEQDEISYTPEKPHRHSPIRFEKEDFVKTPPRKPSILSRLGKRVAISSESEQKKKKTNFSDTTKEESNFERNSDKQRYKRDEDKKRSSERKFSRNRKELDVRERGEKVSVLSRLGVMSKIHVPEKPLEDPDIEDELKTREVRSMVQVKPRVLPPITIQPNKNLLLKAVAEANKSVTEANSKVALKSSKIDDENVSSTRKLSHKEKVKLRNLILAQVSLEDSDDGVDGDKYMEYVPKPIKKIDAKGLPEYVPSTRTSVDDRSVEAAPAKIRKSAKERLERRKSPSPIIFDKISTVVKTKSDVPETPLPIHPPSSVKIQERCKYWPGCRQGDKCEFVHPVTVCESFPNCENGDNCSKIHPNCKFGSGCTKRDCPYTHSVGSVSAVTPPHICKYFPKCANVACPYFHPKFCKFGKYCKNKNDCAFSHSKNTLIHTWKSK